MDLGDLKMNRTANDSVLLFHSSASSSRQWQPLIEQLQPHHRVHAIDLYGHGRRADWPGASPLRVYDDAALALPLLDDGAVHLVGHSYGGAVAMQLALMAPQAVRSLVVYEPVLASWLIDDDAHSPAAREFLAVGAFVARALARSELELAARQFVDYWGGAGTWTAMPAERRQAVAQRMPAVGAHFEAVLAQRLPQSDLAALQVPMLMLQGATTRASTRRVAEMLRAVLPQARHETLHGMGHLGPITHAAEVDACIQGFIEQRLPAMPLQMAALAVA
jgi:pimeloyl-ACP methyl ester carboxylesterase